MRKIMNDEYQSNYSEIESFFALNSAQFIFVLFDSFDTLHITITANNEASCKEDVTKCHYILQAIENQIIDNICIHTFDELHYSNFDLALRKLLFWN